jgi:stage IV sporulation protein FB
MNQGTLRFKVFGFPVAVQLWFWVIMAFIFSNLARGANGFRYLLIGVALGFVSILAHELGHAWFQRKYGGRPYIVLHGMGGYASSEGRFTRKQNLVIIAAGPLVSVSIGIAATILLHVMPITSPVSWFVLNIIQWINLVWGLFNMLPILPMDGGQFFENWMGGRKARLRGQIGAVVAGLIAVYALSRGQIYLTLLAGWMAYYNYMYSEGRPAKRIF